MLQRDPQQNNLPIKTKIAVNFLIITGVFGTLLGVTLLWLGGFFYFLQSLVSLFLGVKLLSKKTKKRWEITIAVLSVEAALLLWILISGLLYAMIGYYAHIPTKEILYNSFISREGVVSFFLPLFSILIPLILLLIDRKNFLKFAISPTVQQPTSPTPAKNWWDFLKARKEIVVIFIIFLLIIMGIPSYILYVIIRLWPFSLIILLVLSLAALPFRNLRMVAFPLLSTILCVGSFSLTYLISQISHRGLSFILYALFLAVIPLIAVKYSERSIVPFLTAFFPVFILVFVLPFGGFLLLTIIAAVIYGLGPYFLSKKRMLLGAVFYAIGLMLSFSAPWLAILSAYGN
ncbi:MAG: hypothetical protein V1702_06360 [Candidatus Woesearchaeota archaeon]